MAGEVAPRLQIFETLPLDKARDPGADLSCVVCKAPTLSDVFLTYCPQGEQIQVNVFNVKGRRCPNCETDVYNPNALLTAISRARWHFEMWGDAVGVARMQSDSTAIKGQSR